MRLNNTKDQITYQSILLFGTYGYQNVSIRQIAAAVGISSGSIYNHFASKDEILDAVIETYWSIFSQYHPSFNKLKELAHSLTAREIMQQFCFLYSQDDILIVLHLLRIQFAEQFQYEKIRKLVFDTLLDGRVKEMTELLEHLIALGKIPPRNAGAMAQMWTSTMGMIAMRAAHSVDFPQGDLKEFNDTTGAVIDLICGETPA